MSHSPRVDATAETIARRLGEPSLGIVLGSGFAPLTEILDARTAIGADEIPGYPEGRTAGHERIVRAARVGGRTVWIFGGRFHLYEGLSVEEVVLPVAVLAAAGAGSVLLTCAAGGLGDDDREGDLAAITDHINLTGTDPVAALSAPGEGQHFPDLQDAYDATFGERMREAALEEGVGLRDGILAAVRGPSFETPAEVRMLRTLGADLVSMSTVPEVIAARYFGLRVAAIACIANRGAGLGGRSIEHADVLDVVTGATKAVGGFLSACVKAMLR